ncbi:hypothetical protein MmiHf6_07490 [Methanimicrococcus hongohii]|uniref:Uncharacterized protein n=1 Tax=Methanimicrococcus hongohii TaxID=3028295 RepID=A0AA96UZ99_9EURY|nr:hypothetical protein [Methanimicrococcus sp. Hf6]WNY23442.1 hypothetical protein MmiHf6_07490 [Methanimicrococcus sp. Hf6]
MAKRNKKQATPNEPEMPEHVEAEKVEAEYHISPSGKIEQTPEEKKRMYKESLLRTVTASVVGIIAGVICYFLLGSAAPVEGETTPLKYAWFVILPLIMIFTYYIQRRLVFPAFRMDMKLLNWKDWFGIQFLVLIYCIVTWTILLNTNIL